MGEGLNQMYSEVSYLPKRVEDEDEDELGESSSLSGASDDEYESPSDHAPSSSSSSHLAAAAAASHGTLHELSSLASHLPNKRGLSKFYQGKSQSFSSFSDVSHVQDLAKKETHQAMKKKKMMMMMKPSRSYAVGLMDDEKDENKPSFVGGPNYNYNSSCNRREARQSGRSSCASSITKTTSGGSYFATGKPPPISTHKNL